MLKQSDEQINTSLDLKAAGDNLLASKRLRAECELNPQARLAVKSHIWKCAKDKILFFYLITAIALITLVEMFVVVGPFSTELKIGAAFALFSSVRAFRKHLLQQ